MNDQPSFDRGLMIPIGVGIFSLVGLCILLVLGRVTALRGNVEEIPTATSFQYQMIGTEPVLVTSTVVELVTEIPSDAEAPTFDGETGFPTFNPPVLLSPNATSARTTIPLQTNTAVTTATGIPSRTPTSASAAPFNPGTYDDTDSRFTYNGNWQTVSGADLETTLHVSNRIGNTVVFRFIGTEIHVFFQAGQSLGGISLLLDTTNYTIDQSNGSGRYEWVLPSVVNGTHTVTITHQSGGSVNLNYIIIPSPPITPTVTITNTPLNQ